MEREEEAHFIFARYDRDRSGFIEEDELATCFSELAVRVNGRAKNKGEAEIREWVAREFRRADANQDGKFSFDEFVTYYNRFVGANRRQFADRYEMGRELQSRRLRLRARGEGRRHGRAGGGEAGRRRSRRR